MLPSMVAGVLGQWKLGVPTGKSQFEISPFQRKVQVASGIGIQHPRHRWRMNATSALNRAAFAGVSSAPRDAD